MEPEVKLVLGDPCLLLNQPPGWRRTDRWQGRAWAGWGLGSSCTHAEPAARTRIGKGRSHGAVYFPALGLPDNWPAVLNISLCQITAATERKNVPLLELPQGLPAQAPHASSQRV